VIGGNKLPAHLLGGGLQELAIGLMRGLRLSDELVGGSGHASDENLALVELLNSLDHFLVGAGLGKFLSANVLSFVDRGKLGCLGWIVLVQPASLNSLED